MRTPDLGKQGLRLSLGWSIKVVKATKFGLGKKFSFYLPVFDLTSLTLVILTFASSTFSLKSLQSSATTRIIEALLAQKDYEKKSNFKN